MPKGVEHIDPYGGDATDSAVFRSLMPKGVEHDDEERAAFECGAQVFRSLMPKGVEHSKDRASP